MMPGSRVDGSPFAAYRFILNVSQWFQVIILKYGKGSKPETSIKGSGIDGLRENNQKWDICQEIHMEQRSMGCLDRFGETGYNGQEIFNSRQ
jgi:hypothetical protein